ncbi:unnamed protein product [Brassica oleracea var. botrytis]|uniref:(rape) hypothetical protein n=1 Tax=Brassica napus TaxID=3708 RepID=A0A078H6X1_BRANA|nr:unnamed protein product [Brassica napus]CDY33606.1 BnaC01g28370D [Brassica napus]
MQKLLLAGGIRVCTWCLKRCATARQRQSLAEKSSRVGSPVDSGARGRGIPPRLALALKTNR